MNFVANAFSLQMVAGDCQVRITNLSANEVAEKLKTSEWMSSIGHIDTAKVVSEQLGITVPYNRGSIQIRPGDNLYVGQVIGGRLPEGTTTLPAGFSIAWKMVEVIS